MLRLRGHWFGGGQCDMCVSAIGWAAVHAGTQMTSTTVCSVPDIRPHSSRRDVTDERRDYTTDIRQISNTGDDISLLDR